MARSKHPKLDSASFGILGQDESFDFVIVGGGTAGLVVASRLTENPSISVAVIEAGGFHEMDGGVVSQLPALASRFSSPIVIDGVIADPHPLIDWSFLTTPQTNLNGRVIKYTQGKTLGGSSARNYMTFNRGTIGFHDKWATEVGDDAYNWKNTLPYFKKSVTFTPSASRSKEMIPLYDVSAFEPDYNSHDRPLRAFRSLGFEENDKLNSGKLMGVSMSPLSFDAEDSTRSSAEAAFLQPALGRANLKIYAHTNAQKVLFDTNESLRAIGVSVNTAGVEYLLRANKEVIISAGVFKSPQILMLSGIGPSETLTELGIPVLLDVPGVGKNMMDHGLFGPAYPVTVTTNVGLQTEEGLKPAMEEYMRHGTGVLTGSPCNLWGFENLPLPLRDSLSERARNDLSTFPEDWPELEHLPMAMTFFPLSGNAVTFATVNIAALSRGTVTISSSSPSDPPIIDPAWLSHKTDQELCVQGFRRARELAKATGMLSGPEIFPGETIQSDADILECLRNTLAPIHHACGTCRMGKVEQDQVVVDSKCRIFGVEGMRVVDASAIPFSPPGHTQATVYMLAEKIVDDILNQHQ